MPDVLTHILFAEMVKDKLEDGNIRHFIHDNYKLYNLGAQGPDFLFYYKPWNPYARAIRETGERMHHNNTAMFFHDAITLLNKSTGSYYEELLVYVLGFLCHYYCDKSIHPYVYSMIETGCYNFGDGRTKLSHYDIEATMDSRFWFREKGIPVSRVKNSEMLNVDYLPDVVADYLSNYIYKGISAIIHDFEIRKAVKNMIKILEILYDPKNNKKKIINKLPLPRKCYIDNGYSNVDVLNENKRSWDFPGVEGLVMKKSVGDLLVESIDECVEVADAICRFLEKGEEADFQAMIPNEDYCTELPLEQ
ncbi:MAG: zinc dependent phospholipase C family protein [Clostridia bacterium]|nr:zinc dependent phospholipase C family protein [Clostridia bacterium]